MRFDLLEVEKRANQLRRFFEHNDIFDLVEQMGIQLIRYPFGKGVLLGFATVFNGRKIIVSNSSEILAREIFTIAHELGHIEFDFDDRRQEMRVDKVETETSEDICEERAHYFASCLLMPEQELRDFIKLRLRKAPGDLRALDLVRIQIEFDVSYSAAVKRLGTLKLITPKHRASLIGERNEKTSSALFVMLGADASLISPTDVIKVPAKFYEYVISNFENGHIPFASLQKALALLGVDAEPFRGLFPEGQNSLKMENE